MNKPTSTSRNQRRIAQLMVESERRHFEDLSALEVDPVQTSAGIIAEQYEQYRNGDLETFRRAFNVAGNRTVHDIFAKTVDLLPVAALNPGTTEVLWQDDERGVARMVLGTQDAGIALVYYFPANEVIS